MTFDNAREECKKLKMDLVISQTAEENMCVQIQIAEQGEKKKHILHKIHYQLLVSLT